MDDFKAEDWEHSSEVYKKLTHSTFAKCQALYNKTSRSAINAEIVQEESKNTVHSAQQHKNLVYNSAERKIRILKEQGEASLPNICASFKIKMLNPAEISYLSEYCIVTKPVSMALNILQSETNTQMGWLLPTIYLLESKLKKIETSVKVCFPLFMLSGKVYKSASGSSWKIQNSLVLQFFFQNSKRHGQTRPTS